MINLRIFNDSFVLLGGSGPAFGSFGPPLAPEANQGPERLMTGLLP